VHVCGVSGCVRVCIHTYTPHTHTHTHTGYPWEFGVTKAAEQTNGRLAMLGIASLAVAQVLKAGCPSIDGPAIAGKEPFCAAFSADGWGWLFAALQTTLHF
jgi:hypothetical protein